MGDSLYEKLYDIKILKRAWHLARLDTQTDYIHDIFNYNDFALFLDKNIKAISIALKEERYHPSSLIYIDIPKSTLSVRPGSITTIEDRIVLFAIVMLIAPELDKKILNTVYSYRIKEKFQDGLFLEDLKMLKYPFLRNKTIRYNIDIIEPWYGQWPKFIEQAMSVYKKEKYNFLTLSDISSYFENINLRILQDILLKHLPKEPKIINLLYSLLKYWTWPTIHGSTIDRGIPQGNDVSRFLGNIYLLPLDEEFEKISKKKKIKYFRYMDDVKIFSKKESIAREVIFIMNDVLRRLHLNIQGTKTVIIKGEDIEYELLDDRLEKVNNVIKNFKTRLIFDKNKRKIAEEKDIKELKTQYKMIKKKEIIQGKDLRLYLRLITGFSVIKSSYMTDNILKEICRNPDARLLAKSISYLKMFPKSSKKIEDKILSFLESSDNLFSYQESRMIELLRYLNNISERSISYAQKCLKSKEKHWYVKVQSALLLSSVVLEKKELQKLKKMYKRENNVEVKKAIIKCLCQLEKEELEVFLEELMYEIDKKLYSVGKMLLSILHNRESALEKEVVSMFGGHGEDFILDTYYKLEVIKLFDHKVLKEFLLEHLNNLKGKIRKKHLNERIENTINFLNKE